MTEWTLENISTLNETTDFEAKLAGGRDGRGELPRAFRETYSAMANTRGGTVCLGLREEDDGFDAVGIQAPDRLVKQLWDTLHDRDQVSANILRDGDVEVISAEGQRLILVRIPRARREDRPVFVGRNPLEGTFLRRHEGDYRCERLRVERMLAERSQDSLDGQILEKFGLDDLDLETLRGYRQRFQNRHPGHVWNSYENEEFLRVLGGWGTDRESGAEGLTLAGLLMFGTSPAIIEVIPTYHVDYRERQEDAEAKRWDDRLIPDGTWSGNLFDFFLLVARRVMRDLRVPFKLEGDIRQDETPAHEALREALVNTLIHADYRGSKQLVVEKYPDRFVFRNPGTMRVSVEDALRGGDSDCRNRALQRMFRMLGLGEQAGSGVPKIFQNWKEQTWRAPSLVEDFKREWTLLELRMVSLLPDETVVRLTDIFGERLASLSDPERVILGTADIEGLVTHARMMEFLDIHPADLSKSLKQLSDSGFLVPRGQTRARSYSLARPTRGQPLPLFPADDGSHESTERSEHMEERSEHMAERSEHTEDAPRLATPQTLAKLRAAKRVQRDILELLLLDLCKVKPRSLVELSTLMGRTPDYLRMRLTRPLVKRGLLALRYPDRKHHPNQEYVTEREPTS